MDEEIFKVIIGGFLFIVLIIILSALLNGCIPDPIF